MPDPSDRGRRLQNVGGWFRFRVDDVEIAVTTTHIFLSFVSSTLPAFAYSFLFVIIMKGFLATVLVLLGISASVASTAFSRGIAQNAESLVFGLPRGGGLFGGAKQ